MKSLSLKLLTHIRVVRTGRWTEKYLQRCQKTEFGTDFCQLKINHLLISSYQTQFKQGSQVTFMTSILQSHQMVQNVTIPAFCFLYDKKQSLNLWHLIRIKPEVLIHSYTFVWMCFHYFFMSPASYLVYYFFCHLFGFVLPLKFF